MDENIYRYTVKCNREANARIERAAKRQGISAGVLAQFFFDRFTALTADLDAFSGLYDTLKVNAAVAAKPAARPATPHSYRPTSAEMTARCDRVHAFLASLPRDADGMTTFMMSGPDGVAAQLGMSESAGGSSLRRLIADQRIFRIARIGKPGTGGTIGTFKVVTE